MPQKNEKLLEPRSLRLQNLTSFVARRCKKSDQQNPFKLSPKPFWNYLYILGLLNHHTKLCNLVYLTPLFKDHEQQPWFEDCYLFLQRGTQIRFNHLRNDTPVITLIRSTVGTWEPQEPQTPCRPNFNLRGSEGRSEIVLYNDAIIEVNCPHRNVEHTHTARLHRVRLPTDKHTHTTLVFRSSGN